MRNTVIIALMSITIVMLFMSLRSMSRRAAYWMNRCDAAERVIDRVEQDNIDYVGDVLSEGDEWNDWKEYVLSL